MRTVIICILLLSVSLATIPVGAADPAVLVSVEEDLHKSLEDPILLTLSTPGGEVPHGRPFEVTATLTAQWTDVSNVGFDLVLPDGVRHVGPPLGTVDLALGVPQEVSFQLQTVEHGVHELRLVASGQSEMGSLGAVRYAYLNVEEGGPGLFTQDLPAHRGDPGLLGSATSSEVGPVLTSTGTFPGPAAGDHVEADGLESGDDGEPGLAGHSTFEVKVCWYYENEAGTGDVPQRFVTVQVWDDDTFGDQLLHEGVTGGDGCYTSPNLPREEGHCCSTGNQDLYLEVHMCNDWACVHDGDGDYYFGLLEFGTVGSQDLIDFGHLKFSSANGIFASRQFQYANNNAWMAVNFLDGAGFSPSGPQVTIEAPAIDGSCPGMFIRRAEDRIYVCPGSDRSPDDVGHEYGHFFQWKLYEPFWPSPGGPHNLCDDNQVLGLAWAEGFGNWYGPFTDWQVGAPGSSGDVNYNRPWDGSGFGFSMETSVCTNGTTGQDNEMGVAWTLWDMVDSAVDGVDVSDTTAKFLASVVASCNDSSLRDFFDGSGCTWAGQGGNRCDLVPAAFQNNIDFNDNVPTATMTSQTSFVWVKDLVTLSASITDADGFGCPLSGDFHISHDSVCNAADTAAGTDSTAPFSRSLNTNGFTDDGSVWACVVPSDGMETGSIAKTAQFGVDNTDPNLGMSFAGTFKDGWYSSPVTVSLSCSDSLSGVDTIEYSDGGFVPYTGPFVVSDEGLNFVLARCTDVAGNLALESEGIWIDTIAPVTSPALAGTLGGGGWYRSPVTVSLSCSEPLTASGCEKTEFRIDGGSWQTYSGGFVVPSEGPHTVEFRSTDVAGNVEATKATSFKIDSLAPATGTSLAGTLGDNGWYVSPVTVSLSCTDPVPGSGCFNTQVAAPAGIFSYVGPFVVSDEGHSDVFYHSADVAGNVEPTGSIGLDIDTVAPLTAVSLAGTIGDNGWYTTAVDVTLSCSDATSGCAAREFRVDGGAWHAYAGTFTVPGEGPRTVEFRSTDVAGNLGAVGATAFKIDTVAPSVAPTGASDGVFGYTAAELLDGVLTNEGTLTVDYGAADATSLLHFVSLDGSSDTFEPGEAAVAGDLTVALPAGLSTWTLQAQDKAGLLSDPVTFEVVYIPPGSFAGGTDPRGAGYWQQAVSKGDLTEAELAGLLVLVNAASSHFGAGETFGEVDMTNYQVFLELPKPPATDDKVRRSLLTAWLNFASGRLPAAASVDLSPVLGWETVVLNTGGSPLTTALNTLSEAEHRFDPSVSKGSKNTIRDVVEALNNGDVLV